MTLEEGYTTKLKHVVVADPVPKIQEHSTTPCGTCRHVIWERGTPDTKIICIQYIQKKDEWTFPKMEEHTIKELYPHLYEPVDWDSLSKSAILGSIVSVCMSARVND